LSVSCDMAPPNGAIEQLMERKIGQLSKVIYHLNAKGDEGEPNLSGKASAYENEIEGILQEASERVRRFHAACAHKQDAKLIEAKTKEIEARYEQQRRVALKEVEEYKRKAEASQATIRQECEGKVAAMQKDLDAQKKEFAARMKQFAEVGPRC
jgi:hypothetical protein